MTDKQISAYDFLGNVLRHFASVAAQTAAYGWDDAFARKEIRDVWRDDDAPLRRRYGRRVTLDELRGIGRDRLLQLGFGNWDGRLLTIPLWAINYISAGTPVECINGEKAILHVDEIDNDVRLGCIAYGITLEDAA